MNMLLLLSGDIESNPGPDGVAEFSTSVLLEAIQRIERGQLQLRTDLREWEKGIESRLKNIEERMECLEKGKVNSQDNPSFLANQQGSASTITQDLGLLKAAADDAENRLRRNNHLFLAQGNTVVALCAQSLNSILKGSVEDKHTRRRRRQDDAVFYAALQYAEQVPTRPNVYPSAVLEHHD